MSNNNLEQQLEQIDLLDTESVVQLGRRQRQLNRDRSSAYNIVRVERTDHSANKSRRRSLQRALVERAEAFAAFIVIVESKGLGGGWMAPNEARAAENMAPVPGGDTPYLQ